MIRFFISRRFLTVVSGILFLAGCLAAAEEAPNIKALRVGHLIDPATGKVAPNQTILVKDGKIAEVGAKVQVPDGAEVIDLSAAWAMPGLMDAHTHMTIRALSTSYGLEFMYLKESSAARVLRGLRNAQDVLGVGFTAIRDVGNDANYVSIDLRNAINKGLFSGPTIVATGKIIAPFGGQLAKISPEQGRFWLYEYIDADSPEEVRKAVREVIFYGADAVKLVADNSDFHFTLEEIKAAVEEAHASGRVVSVHVMGGEAARNCILGGVDSIEHGFGLTDELLRLMKKHKTALVGTEFPEAHLKAMSQEGKAFGQVKDFASRIVDRLRRAYRLGVTLVFGTDTVGAIPGKTRGEMMLDYLDVWTAAGVPPAETLKALTTNAARLLGLEKKRGAIAAGQAADIIAMAQSPLENIQALRQVTFIMKDGKVIKSGQK